MAFLGKTYNNNFIQKLFETTKYIHRQFRLKNTLIAEDAKMRDILFSPLQSEKDKKHRKVTIVGAAGKIGNLMVYEILLRRLCDEIVLTELPEKRGAMCGLALDILDGTSFHNYPRMKIGVNCEYTENSDVIIVTAGLGVKLGKSRLDVLKDNADNFRTLIPELAKRSPNAILLIVSNPVDLMTYAAWRFSGFPTNRVLGTGTSLDSSRFKLKLSERLGISPKCITAYMLGEHGQSAFANWSTINVAGTRLRDCQECFGLKDDPDCWLDLEKEVKERAYNIKKHKGFTSFAISMVVAELTEAILMDKRTVHPVSTYCKGVCDLKLESWFSFPAVIGNKGVHQIIKMQFDEVETEKLHKSAAALDKAMKSYNWEGDEAKKEQCQAKCN